MKTMRILAILLASCMFASLLVGCDNSSVDPTQPSTETATENTTDEPKEYKNAKKFQEFMIVHPAVISRTGHKFLLDSIREYSGSDKEPKDTTNMRKEAQYVIVYGSKGGIDYGDAQALAEDLLPGQYRLAYRKTSEPDEESEDGVYVEEKLYILGGSDAMSIKGVEYFLTHYIINDEAFPEEDFTYTSVNRPELSDPCILLDGDTYYMYGSYINNGYYYYTSKDLVTWTDAVCAITAESFGAEYCMNPEVHKINDKYYLVGTYGKNGVRHIGSFVGDSAAGPFTPVAADLSNPAWNCIDPTLYVDGDGKVWMAYVAETGFADADFACMMLVEVKNDLTATIGDARIIFRPDKGILYEEDDWLEGPCFVKTEKGTVLLMYTGYTNHRNRYKYFSSARLMGSNMASDSWHVDNFVMYARDWELPTGNITTMFSGGHSFVFKDKDGKTKIAYHIDAEDSDYGYIEIFDLEYDDVDDIFMIAHDPLIMRFEDPELEE